jgi:DNA polymerase-1
MLACYVGDNLKDMHSMTAAGAMEKKWGKTVLAEMIERFGKPDDSEYELFLRLRKCKEDEAVAKMADDLRKNAKNVNFGAQYDAMAPKLAETLIIPVADAQAFLEAKFAMFPRFEEWKEEVKSEAGKLGYVTTCLGARRHLREAILSDNKWDMEKAMRQGPNFKIQGSSAEQTKLAMARVWRSGVLWKYDVVFFATIHDELVFSVHRDHALEVIKIFHDAMVEPYGNLPVPFLGSISLGPNFGKQHEAGDWYIEENIKEILAKLFVQEVAEVV